MIKKIVTVIGIVSGICFALLFVNYMSNEKFIKNYNEGVYESSRVTPVLGFTQPYVYHYNQGNIYYNRSDYEGAEQEYRKALESGLSGDKDCKARINLALSMVTPIDVENVTADNLDETIEILENAKNVLIENGCAHRDDENGHNSEAQTLKDEIDAFEEQLRNQVEEQEKEEKEDSEEDEQKSESGDEGSTEEQDEGSDELKEQLDELQEKGLNQRNQELDDYSSYNSGNYGYYDGQTW